MTKNMILASCGAAAVLMAAAKDQGSKAAPAPVAETPTLADGVSGFDLLAEIAASPTGEVLMTREQAAEAIDHGFVTADETRVEGNRAPVKLTDEGFAAFQAGETSAAETPAARSNIEIDDDVPMPQLKQRRGAGRNVRYPFDQLEVGQSFHVPATAKMPKPAEQLASTISGARAKYAEDTAETKSVVVKEYKRNADGN